MRFHTADSAKLDLVSVVAMGNTPPALAVQPELRISYLGPTIGGLPKDQPGCIRSNHIDPVSSEARPAALSPELADHLNNSLGAFDKLPMAPSVRA